MWKQGIVLGLWIFYAMMANAQSVTDSDSTTAPWQVSPSAIKDTIHAKADDSLVIHLTMQHLRLHRQVDAQYQTLRFKGDLLRYDWTTKRLWGLPTNDSSWITFYDGSDAYRARRMAYHFPTGSAYMEDLRFAEGEGFIHSLRVAKDSNNYIYGYRTLYTTCPADSPHYAILSRKIKIIPHKLIISGPAILTIAGIPTLLAIPFGFFPIPKQQASGIILPAYGESEGRGFFLRDGGIFWAINDYADLALTGDIYSFGGWAARLRSRYKLRYRFSGEVQLAYAYNVLGLPETPNRQTFTDFLFRWSHQKEQAANPYFDFSADVNISSSNYLRLNSYRPDQIVTNVLQSSIHFQHRLANGRHIITAALNHSQNSATHQMTLMLPQISYSIRRIYPFRKWRNAPQWLRKVGTHYQWQFRNQWLTTDSTLTQFRWQDETHFGAVHQIPFSTSLKLFRYLSISPSFQYRGFFNFYELTRWVDSSGIEHQRRSPTTFRYLHDFSYSLNTTTRLYGFLYAHIGRLQVLRHTLQPSLSFSVAPDFSASPWHYYRYYSTPEGDSIRYYPYETLFGQPTATSRRMLNFSINNVLEAKIRTDDTTHPIKQRTWIDNLWISGKYDFTTDSFALSPLTLGFRTHQSKISIQTTALLDPYAYDSIRRQPIQAWKMGQGIGHITTASFSLNYALSAPQQWASAAFLNMTYTANYSRNPLSPAPIIRHTINIRGEMRPSAKWRLSISSGYDFSTRSPTFTSINVYRDLHCWEMSLQIIPWGFRKSYHFRINVKAATLRDLKIEKRKDYFDFIR